MSSTAPFEPVLHIISLSGNPRFLSSVAEWAHFTFFGVISHTNYKADSVHESAHTFGLLNSATK